MVTTQYFHFVKAVKIQKDQGKWLFSNNCSSVFCLFYQEYEKGAHTLSGPTSLSIMYMLGQNIISHSPV